MKKPILPDDKVRVNSTGREGVVVTVITVGDEYYNLVDFGDGVYPAPFTEDELTLVEASDIDA